MGIQAAGRERGRGVNLCEIDGQLSYPAEAEAGGLPRTPSEPKSSKPMARSLSRVARRTNSEALLQSRAEASVSAAIKPVGALKRTTSGRAVRVSRIVR